MTRNRGFTLVEVLVALTLASLVVLMAHRLFAGVLDGVRRLQIARESLDREGNVRRLLGSLAGSAEVDRNGNAFSGGPSEAVFTAWWADSVGCAVRRRVTIRVEEGVLTLRGVYPDGVPLLPEVQALELDYLLNLGAEQRFVRQWESDASAPLAIRFRIRRGTVSDTLLLLVGGRG